MENTETLARRFFELVAARDRVSLAELLHPDVVFTALTIPGVFEGRDNVMKGFYDMVYAWPLYDAYATTFEVLRAGAVRASGRLRWMSDGHLRDASAEWTLTFCDGCLYRLTSGEAGVLDSASHAVLSKNSIDRARASGRRRER